jgi:hypothetical protein
MPSKDQYISVAKQVVDYLNAFGLAFKTYNTKELDDMIKAVAGEGARVSTKAVGDEIESAMLERGLICFPKIAEAEDGYVRIYRAGSVAANLLQAFRYPGPSGDSDLASLLRALHRARGILPIETDEG